MNPLVGPCLLSVGLVDSRSGTVIPWIVIFKYFCREFLVNSCAWLHFSLVHLGAF